MPASGLLISWATTAASFPSDAIFSTITIWWCVFSSWRVFSSTRCSSVRLRPSRSSRACCEVARHLVPRAGELAHLVAACAPARAPRGRPSPARSMARAQPLHRPQHERPEQEEAEQRGRRGRSRTARTASASRRRASAASACAIESRTSRMPRTRCVAGCTWHGGALRLVVDRRDDPEDAAAAARGASGCGRRARGRPSAAARRGRRCTASECLSTSEPSSSRRERDPDPALLVVDADGVDALLGGDVLDDPAHAVGVVAEHPVVGGAVDDAGGAVGRRARRGPRAALRWPSRLSWSATQRMAAAPSPSPRPMRTARRLQGRRRLATEVAARSGVGQPSSATGGEEARRPLGVRPRRARAPRRGA